MRGCLVWYYLLFVSIVIRGGWLFTCLSFASVYRWVFVEFGCGCCMLLIDCWDYLVLVLLFVLLYCWFDSIVFV